jgi:O-antigen/teichoic acid export membrane protein
MPLPKASSVLISNSFFIFIIRFFPSLANLLVMIWYSRHLPGSDYGHYVNFWVQLLVIYPIICFGIHVLLVTYSKGFIIDLLKKIKTHQFALFLVWTVLLSAVFALLQYSLISLPFAIPFLFIFSYALTFILESFLIVFKAYASLVVTSLFYSVAFCIIHWYVLCHGFSLQLLFNYLLVITVLRFVIYGIISFLNIKQYQPEGSFEDVPMEKICSLWLHLGLYDLLQVLFSYTDKFIISLVLVAPLSAIYYNGSQNIPFIPLLLSAAGTAVLMQLANRQHPDERSSLVRLMNQSGRVLSSIVLPVFFFLFLFRTELILELFLEPYRNAIPVFAVSILVIPVRSYNFTTVLQRLHKGNIINIGAIADLVLACVLMYPLYLWLGLPGVALSFVITTYMQAAFYLLYSAKLLNASPLKLIPYVNWSIKLIVFASLFIGIHYVGVQYFTQKNTLILGLVVMVVTIAVSLVLELNKQSNNVNN